QPPPPRAHERGSPSRERPAPAAADQAVAGSTGGGDRRPGAAPSNDPQQGPGARHPARGADLPAAEHPLHATVRAGVKSARARTTTAGIHRQLRRRLRDLLPRNGHASHGCDAGDDAEAAADGERDEDAAVPRRGRSDRLSRVHHRAMLLAEDGQSLYWHHAVEEEDPATVSRDQRADRTP